MGKRKDACEKELEIKTFGALKITDKISAAFSALHISLTFPYPHSRWGFRSRETGKQLVISESGDITRQTVLGRLLFLQWIYLDFHSRYVIWVYPRDLICPRKALRGIWLFSKFQQIGQFRIEEDHFTKTHPMHFFGSKDIIPVISYHYHMSSYSKHLDLIFLQSLRGKKKSNECIQPLLCTDFQAVSDVDTCFLLFDQFCPILCWSFTFSSHLRLTPCWLMFTWKSGILMTRWDCTMASLSVSRSSLTLFMEQRIIS